MKKYILPVIVLLYVSCQPKVYDEYSCRINRIYHGSYSDDYDYSEYKECVVKDSLIINEYVKENFQNCFCSGKIKHINTHYNFRHRRKIVVTIEPIYFDVDNCTGLYGERVYYLHGLTPRYFDGFPHNLFLINQGEFIDLNDLDSLEIKEILYAEGSNFQKIFQKKDLDRIYNLAKRGVWWNFQVIRIPIMIIKDEEVIFDTYEQCE